jgi:RNA-binding protein 5/10
LTSNLKQQLPANEMDTTMLSNIMTNKMAVEQQAAAVAVAPIATTASIILPAAATAAPVVVYTTPDVSKFTYDEKSGYYYDYLTGFYYDAASQYHYNPLTQQYMYWDALTSNYIPVAAASGNDKTGKEGPTTTVDESRAKTNESEKQQSSSTKSLKSSTTTPKTAAQIAKVLNLLKMQKNRPPSLSLSLISVINVFILMFAIIPK